MVLNPPADAGGNGLGKIKITIEHLIMGDFAAAAAMITYGAILGKANL